MEFGKKQKHTPLLDEKLKKACRCSLSMAPGCHKESCNFHPSRMKEVLRHHATARRSVAKQFERTTPTPKQREAALDHLFGPESSS